VAETGVIVMLFKFMDTNFRSLRQNCIFMDTKIYGSPAIVNAYEYGDIYSMNSTFHDLVLSRKSMNIGIPQIIMNSQYYGENNEPSKSHSSFIT